SWAVYIMCKILFLSIVCKVFFQFCLCCAFKTWKGSFTWPKPTLVSIKSYFFFYSDSNNQQLFMQTSISNPTM
ncbi:hypothetical protein VIGAN_06202100, partial [Vigna angularis var. angularis]